MKKIIYQITFLLIVFITMNIGTPLVANSATINNWWQPKPNETWQIQLTGKINTSYSANMYDIDLEETPQSVIDKLHAGGHKVICYFSAGSYEYYRADAGKFPKEVLGRTLSGWPDEKWLDIAHYEKFAHIMKSRLDLAVQKKCDGVDPDNVDSYTNRTGFKLTYADQLRYNRWLATEAHNRNLSIGLKNDLNQITDLVKNFDFAINEQCFQYDECDLLKPFIEANKAVFGVEYDILPKKFCPQANQMQYSFLKSNINLNGRTKSCQNY
jgi:hypothetical protein